MIKLAFAVYYKPQASCFVSTISLLIKTGSVKKKKKEKSKSGKIRRKKNRRNRAL